MKNKIISLTILVTLAFGVVPWQARAQMSFSSFECAGNLTYTGTVNDLADLIDRLRDDTAFADRYFLFEPFDHKLDYTVDSVYNSARSSPTNDTACLSYLKANGLVVGETYQINARAFGNMLDLLGDLDSSDFFLSDEKVRDISDNELKRLRSVSVVFPPGGSARPFRLNELNAQHPKFATPLPAVDTVPCALNILNRHVNHPHLVTDESNVNEKYVITGVYHRFEQTVAADKRCLNYLEVARHNWSNILDILESTVVSHLPSFERKLLKTAPPIFSVPVTGVSYTDSGGYKLNYLRIYPEAVGPPNALGPVGSIATAVPDTYPRTVPYCSVNIAQDKDGNHIYDSVYSRVYHRFDNNVDTAEDDVLCLKQLAWFGVKPGQSLGREINEETTRTPEIMNQLSQTTFAFSVPLVFLDDEYHGYQRLAFLPDLAGPVNFGRATNQTGDQTEPSPTKTTTETNSVTATNDEELRSLLLQLLQLLQAR